MAQHSNLPCNGDGVCMVCQTKPPEAEILCCNTCVSPWHATCLSIPLETLAGAVEWECPDCSSASADHEIPLATTAESSSSNLLIASIRAIESDQSLTDQEKAKRRQNFMSGGGLGSSPLEENVSNNETINGDDNSFVNLLDGRINCSICMQLPERPITTPCGHNFCLKCFQKWVGLGKRSCANCRSEIPPKMVTNPRINSVLAVTIRMAKVSTKAPGVGEKRLYHFVHNQNRPEKAYTTERAKKAGKANACSGKIFVTVPPDYFGPILAENDPERNQGVLVGETWEDRMECRQWGAHLPHIAGIAGKADYGSQSVALSGGYIDDEDHGEWFLYTGSGGRDLSGNKRINKTQSSDQKFVKFNEALRISCKKGYPVRVVRSHKEKRSFYAPETGVRYDGVYRIEKCWRKIGVHGFKVCRYLFVRCDNVPAPWTSDEHGDRPRSLPAIEELKKATDVTERKESPSWDYDEEKSCWMWKKPPPESRQRVNDGGVYEKTNTKRRTQAMTVRERLLKEFNCLICKKVMSFPLTTPCAHNFCKACLEGAFTGQAFIKERTCNGRRNLRAQKTIMKCPSCSIDISDFLQNPQVNRELMGVIESLQHESKKESENNDPSEEETNDGGGAEKKLKLVSEDAESSVTILAS
ncbi:E3 ubiquitin-protein ligase ORTHRUS 2-like isoform X1 [Impatiens glandulifera]|uniref:E3 ubiquitin-protein ligase ORTHRUS 2-like isoform X1 n=1 Tax=Impatiens glandulifera TaxID=253017 RepID=UPI001FB074A6|nr:E3 ubiquitin-protein ligase ORTHRUS 2-like isoform X1 [Impatiens glandulifera]